LNDDVDASTFQPNAGSRGLIGGKYEVIAELGRGGFGTVFKARHAGLNKLVAIKVLHASLLVDEVTRSRFELEAKAGANLSHPNLVSVLDNGFTERGEPYLVMEFVEGTTLDQFLSTGSPQTDDLLNILIQVGKAVRYLHDSNIIHRDLKTSNILVQDIGCQRYARLLDLGIAKVFSPDGGEKNVQLTSTGMIFGSPAFMSPEQCQGQVLDARSDIYSFGCVIYQCLMGDIPFSGENSLQVILKHLHETPKALPYKTQRQYELTQVVSKCLAKDRTHRYHNMKELLDALQKIAVAPPNEKAQIRQDNLSRSYAEPSGMSDKPKQILGAVAALLVIAIVVACAIPLCGMLLGQMSKGVEYTVKIPPATTAAQQVQAKPVTQPEKSVSDQLSQQIAASEAAAERLRTERLALEKVAADQAARLAAERQMAENAVDLQAVEKAAADKALSDEATNRALVRQKVEALAKASNERFDLVQQQLRSFDQSAQNLQSGNMSLRQYNDRMAQPSGAGR